MSITIRVTFWRVMLLLWVVMSVVTLADTINDIGTLQPAWTVSWRHVLVGIELFFTPLLIGFMVGRESRGAA